MPRNEIVLRIGGESGEGMVTTGEVFARVCAHAGLEVYTFRTYPAEILGGHVLFQIRAGDRPILSQGDELDLLLAFNLEAYDKHHGELRRGGVMIYDDRTFSPPEDGADQIRYAVPLTQLAEKARFARGKNIVAVGVLVGLLDLPLEKAQDVVRSQLGRKGEEAVKKNLQALEIGYRHVKEEMEKKDPFHLRAVEREHDSRLVMQGNQVIGMGALAGGCRFYAGYPITPASDLMEFLAALLPRFGGTMVQAEDEIAALSMVLGASFAGKRAMTATSGPGFSLMAELVGLSGMAEIPCVIADVQRGGPSTGLPTKTEQGDLLFALHGGHGDFPRIVLAPTSVYDCFMMTVHAFNFAEKYQVPVILLSDQALSHRVETIPALPFDQVELYEREIPQLENKGGPYLRYRVTESGISPISIPSIPNGQYTAEGLEHDETGAPKWDAANHERMMEKRFRKLETCYREEVAKHKLYIEEGPDDAEIGVLSWGSSAGPALEAVHQAQEKGLRVAFFAPKILSPLPKAQMESFMRNKQRLLVAEVNFLGHFARVVQAEFGVKVATVRAYGGLPFKPSQVRRAIEDLANGKAVRITDHHEVLS